MGNTWQRTVIRNDENLELDITEGDDVSIWISDDQGGIVADFDLDKEDAVYLIKRIMEHGGISLKDLK